MTQRFLPPDEKEIREKIFQEIMAMDLSEGKEISADWYGGSLRTRLACAIVARMGADDGS